jgi:hypothetical protein
VVEELDWPVEPIPDGDSVFMRAHRAHFRNGDLQPGVFKAQGDGMSVDWDKYSTAEQSRLRAKKPDENAILRLSVLGIRSTEPLRVVHEPDPQHGNRAHTEVFDMPKAEQLAETRIKLLRIAVVAIPIPPAQAG